MHEAYRKHAQAYQGRIKVQRLMNTLLNKNCLEPAKVAKCGGPALDPNLYITSNQIQMKTCMNIEDTKEYLMNVI